jgi:formylglycine-generating enzyme required for sulfatase activity
MLVSVSREFAIASLVVLILGTSASSSLAQRNLAVQSTQSAGERVALVIGNSTYKNAPLSNPANDATDMVIALRANGFKVIRRTNASQRDMRSAIREFAAELRRAEVGLFYFAGHGVQVRGNNYLVPVDADIQSEADAEDLSIDANYVLRTMEEAQAKVNIVILDACRNNPYSRGFRSASRGLAQMNAAAGSLIAFSTAPGSVAADGKGRNGTYTKHLLASLRAADTDVLRVFQRTRAGVVRETGGKQTPWESTSLVGEFYFRPGLGVASTPSTVETVAADPMALELEFWNAVKDSKNADELKAYIEQYPSGRFLSLARARLKVVESGPPAQVASTAPTTSSTKPGALQEGTAVGTIFRDCQECPEMVFIAAGSFTMGSSESETERDSNEGPEHQVIISRPFAAGRYEITFDEWESCLKERGCNHDPNDQGWGRGKRPVVNVSWSDAKEYVAWLSRKTGKGYRLLSEAEWEYVARAGTTTAFNTGVSISIGQGNFSTAIVQRTAGLAWGVSTEGQADPDKTAPVGSYVANRVGLHDVHGNVWEWVEDCTNADYFGAPRDGSAWTTGDCSRRILRGGSFIALPKDIRSARRFSDGVNARYGTFGFRVARSH